MVDLGTRTLDIRSTALTAFLMLVTNTILIFVEHLYTLIGTLVSVFLLVYVHVGLYKKVEPRIRERTKAKIQVRIRDWNASDIRYWSQFNINKDILCIFDVKPITHYWINEQRFSCDSISYRYRFDCGYKIYRPLERDFKWSSNVGAQCLQGHRQLPEHGKIVFLTSSLKDVMCLASIGYPSFALQSEMLMPQEGTIEEAKARFEEVIVLYDNDFDKGLNPGQTMATKICGKYGLDNLVIPSYYRSKDISDLTKDHGIEEAKNVIKRKENRQTHIKKKVRNAKSKEVDGIKFRSQLEAHCYRQLRDAGIKSDYEKKKYVLMEGFHYSNISYEDNGKTGYQDKQKYKVEISHTLLTS